MAKSNGGSARRALSGLNVVKLDPQDGEVWSSLTITVASAIKD